jgi:ubiquinone/menaquinone biosynthesis C-methylase UbiE
MNLIQKLYLLIHKAFSRPEQRGSYSAGYWQDKVRRVALALAGSYRGRLLEVGCGEGFFLANLCKANPNIEAWGVDRSSEILMQARDLFKKEGLRGEVIVEGDVQKLPFDNAFFDSVVCINVFICLTSDQAAAAALREISRVSKPKARLILEFRNRRNPFLKIKYKLARYYDATTKDHPLSTYDEDDVSRMLTESGFRICEKRYLDFPIKKLAPIIILEAQKNA